VTPYRRSAVSLATSRITRPEVQHQFCLHHVEYFAITQDYPGLAPKIHVMLHLVHLFSTDTELIKPLLRPDS